MPHESNAGGYHLKSIPSPLGVITAAADFTISVCDSSSSSDIVVVVVVVGGYAFFVPFLGSPNQTRDPDDDRDQGRERGCRPNGCQRNRKNSEVSGSCNIY